MWILLLSFFTAATARGRYEFIDDADLPAFYSLRSAQLAQQAAALQSGPSPTGVPGTQLYSPYYPYHIYQPAVTETQGQTLAGTPIQYAPYIHYSPPSHVYRPQSASVVTSSGVQPRIVYSPYYYGHQAASSGQLKTKKKVV